MRVSCSRDKNLDSLQIVPSAAVPEMATLRGKQENTPVSTKLIACRRARNLESGPNCEGGEPEMRYCGRACLLALVLMIATGCSKPGPSQRGRPNILFIYTDDQSWRTVASYSGRTWVRTPNLDRLSSEGMRFTFAYAASWCAPSRATAMTGLLPHGIRGLHFSNDVDATYDPDLFRLWPRQSPHIGCRSGCQNFPIANGHFF